MKSTSNIYYPYRKIGKVTDGIPLAHYNTRESNILISSIGDAFQLIDLSRLHITQVSPSLATNITCIACAMPYIYTAHGSEITVWCRSKRVRQLSSFRNIGESGEIISMIVVGDYLIVVDTESNVKIWNTLGNTFVSYFVLEDNLQATCLCHPYTYLNKIIIGFSNGTAQLWNIHSRKLVYRFDKISKKKQAITCIKQSPAIDVVAVGFNDGDILIFNLKYDTILFKFEQGGKVTDLSFRTDAAASKMPLLASGTLSGNIHFWNLEEKRHQSTILNAHSKSVSSVIFLEKQPILVTSSPDNSIKVWIFDSPDGSARLLKSKEGHSLPPTKIRFYGGTTIATMGDGSGLNYEIVSCGPDRTLRSFSTVFRGKNREFSQKPLIKNLKSTNAKNKNKKFNQIIAFDCCETRFRDWGDIVTCHQDDYGVHVWRMKNYAITDIVLKKKIWRKDPVNAVAKYRALCVCITVCGNFALIGTRCGIVFKYNIQSGLERGSYPLIDPKEEKNIKKKGYITPGSIHNLHAQTRKRKRYNTKETKKSITKNFGHSGAVYGVRTDALNRYTITGSIDSTIIFWNFKTHQLIKKINIGSGISQLEIVRDSNLIAAACDDHIVRLYDISSQKLVRKFSGHTNQLTDLTFTYDGKRLITSSMDRTIRVWDLPTGQCIDWLEFKKTVTSVAVSPSNDILCTTHVGEVGLNLWVDRSFYQNVFLDQVPLTPFKMDEPTMVADDGDDDNNNKKNNNNNNDNDNDDKDNENDNIDEENYKKLKQLEIQQSGNSTDKIIDLTPKTPGAVTLSTLPLSYWQTLFNLELIKERNKPEKPPQAPARAPFFLPTIHKDGNVMPSFPEEFLMSSEDNKNNDNNEFEQLAALHSAWSDNEDDKNDDNEENEYSSSRILKDQPIFHRSNVAKLLENASNLLSNKKKEIYFPNITQYLMQLTPSNIDVEMRAICFGEFDQEGLNLVSTMLDYFKYEVESHRNFEVIQAYLNRFLKIYSDILMKTNKFKEKVKILDYAQTESSQRIQDLMQHSLCLLELFTKIQT